MKGQIILNKTSAPIDVSEIRVFTVTQNNKSSIVHEVNFERNGSSRKMLFLNFSETMLKGSRYVPAQSNPAFCAKLVLLPD